MPLMKEWKIFTSRSAWGPQLAWISDSRIIACSNYDGTIDLWDVDSGSILRTLLGRDFPLDVFTSSRDGKIVAGTFDFAMDEPIRLWDVASGRQWHTHGSHYDFVIQLAFSPEGTLLASAASDVKLWDITTGQELRTLDGDAAVAFSPDGTTLASLCRGENASDSRGAIRLWNVASGEGRKILQGSPASINEIVFSPDGANIISIGRKEPMGRTPPHNDLITIWDLATGRELGSFKADYNVSGLTIHPDGKMLATKGEYPKANVDNQTGNITLWEMTSGNIIQNETFKAARVSSIAFSHEGSLLAVGDSDRLIRLWEVIKP